MNIQVSTFIDFFISQYSFKSNKEPIPLPSISFTLQNNDIENISFDLHNKKLPHNFLIHTISENSLKFKNALQEQILSSYNINEDMLKKSEIFNILLLADNKVFQNSLLEFLSHPSNSKLLFNKKNSDKDLENFNLFYTLFTQSTNKENSSVYEYLLNDFFHLNLAFEKVVDIDFVKNIDNFHYHYTKIKALKIVSEHLTPEIESLIVDNIKNDHYGIITKSIFETFKDKISDESFNQITQHSKFNPILHKKLKNNLYNNITLIDNIKIEINQKDIMFNFEFNFEDDLSSKIKLLTKSHAYFKNILYRKHTIFYNYDNFNAFSILNIEKSKNTFSILIHDTAPFDLISTFSNISTSINPYVNNHELEAINPKLFDYLTTVKNNILSIFENAIDESFNLSETPINKSSAETLSNEYKALININQQKFFDNLARVRSFNLLENIANEEQSSELKKSNSAKLKI